MRNFLFALIALCLAPLVEVKAQALRFNARGEFKIVQFTDLHYRLDDPRSDAALQCITDVLAKEKPQLAVFTGDNIYSKPGDMAMKRLVAHIDVQGVPFVMLFGNHDEEQGFSNATLYDIIRKAKNNVMPERGSNPSPDYALAIKDAKGQRAEAVIYCIDSHNHVRTQLAGEKGYAFITPEQVEWYRRSSDAFTKANGGQPLPAVAFFHIPFPEYYLATSDPSVIMYGTRMEAPCSPKLNTGLFVNMRVKGDVMGVFCGHDHDNDFAAMYHGILLAYGRFSGGNTEYNHLANGARVIVLKEGKRKFDTWIRERGNDAIKERTSFPKSYVKDDWTKR